jgi:hypothetical protein
MDRKKIWHQKDILTYNFIVNCVIKTDGQINRGDKRVREWECEKLRKTCATCTTRDKKTNKNMKVVDTKHTTSITFAFIWRSTQSTRSTYVCAGAVRGFLTSSNESPDSIYLVSNLWCLISVWGAENIGDERHSDLAHRLTGMAREIRTQENGGAQPRLWYVWRYLYMHIRIYYPDKRNTSDATCAKNMMGRWDYLYSNCTA